MTGWRYRSYLSLLWVVALLALLAVLAVLQYRWTGEASQAEQERMRQGLRESLSYFQRTFDRELTRIVVCYSRPTEVEGRRPRGRDDSNEEPGTRETEPADWRVEAPQNLVEASRQWRVGAENPRLVGDIFVAESLSDGHSVLFRFDGVAGRLDGVPWPSALARFREVLENENARRRSHEQQEPEAGVLVSPYVADEIPALVMPLSIGAERRRLPGSSAREVPVVRARAVLVVCLNRDFLYGEWIPNLARRYLPSGEGGEYDYALVGRNSRAALFASNEANTERIILENDASVNLMRLELEGFEEELSVGPDGAGGTIRIRQGVPGAPSGNPSGEAEPPRGGTPGGFRVTRPSPSAEDQPHATSRSHVAPGLPHAVIEQVAEERHRHMQRFAEVFAAQGWRLLVKNRSGSLDQMVAAARIRNLAVSLGILLILAASLVALMIAVRRAQRLARQQMEFVAGVSHELRTPIAVICSNAENLADGLIRKDDQVRRYGRFILREGRRLGALLEQTLEFAGISSGQRRLDLRPIDVGALAHQTVGAFKACLTRENVRVEEVISSGPLVAETDAPALSCALENLLSNAVKYSPSGGTVRVTVQSSASGEAIELSVEDQGMGIERAELDRIFEPFFRGGNAVKAQIRGAGVGLSLVKRILDAHGATIKVSSEIGEGSVFTMILRAFKQNSEDVLVARSAKDLPDDSSVKEDRVGHS